MSRLDALAHLRIGTLEGCIRGRQFDTSKKSPRVNRRLVWWRRGELNPCPKIVNASDLHV